VRAFLIENEALTRRVYYHDWTIYALSRTWNLPWTFDAAATMSYRQHERNDTGARASLGGVSARLGKIRAGWYRTQLLAISDICLKTAGSNAVITSWHAILNEAPSFRRRWKIVRFCIRGGRRRRSDRCVLIAAALLGWI
jgi:hypothetical protein